MYQSVTAPAYYCGCNYTVCRCIYRRSPGFSGGPPPETAEVREMRLILRRIAFAQASYALSRPEAPETTCPRPHAARTPPTWHARGFRRGWPGRSPGRRRMHASREAS